MKSIAFIQEAVARHYGFAVDALLSPRRNRAIARPRQVAMAISFRLVPLASLPQLGRAFRRDHTTVLRGIAAIERLKAGDDAFAKEVDRLEGEIRGALVAQPWHHAESGAVIEGVVETVRTQVRLAVRRDPVGFLRRLREICAPLMVAACVLLPSPAPSQETEPLPSCLPEREMIERLQKQFGETVVAGGDDFRKVGVAVYATHDGRTWTILAYSNGTACVLAAGKEWAGRAIPAPPPIEERPT